VRRLGAVPCGDGTAEVQGSAPACACVAAGVEGRDWPPEREGDGCFAGSAPLAAGAGPPLVADAGNRRVECSR